MPEPEDPEKDLRDASDVDAIQNLDTARMTLRWALERLRALEKLNKELTAKAEWEFKMRLKSEEDFKSQWELERSHFEGVQRQREAQLEKNFAAKLVEWERSYQKAEDEQRAKLANLEQAEKQRLGRLTEKENEFDRYCELQKQHAEAERRQIRADAQKDSEERFKTLQKLADERMSTLGATWQRERDSLIRDMEAWRRRAEESVTRAFELERSSRSAEEISRSTTRLADERETEYVRLSESWENQRQALDQQVRHWQDQATLAEGKALELEKGRRFIEDQVRQATRLAEDRQAEAAKMVEAWDRQRATLDEQIRQWQKRAAESDTALQQERQEHIQAKRLAERSAAEGDLLRAEADKRRDEVLEFQALEGRLKSKEAEAQALAAGAQELRMRLGQAEERLGRAGLESAEYARIFEEKKAAAQKAAQEEHELLRNRAQTLEHELELTRNAQLSLAKEHDLAQAELAALQKRWDNREVEIRADVEDETQAQISDERAKALSRAEEIVRQGAQRLQQELHRVEEDAKRAKETFEHQLQDLRRAKERAEALVVEREALLRKRETAFQEELEEQLQAKLQEADALTAEKVQAQLEDTWDEREARVRAEEAQVRNRLTSAALEREAELRKEEAAAAEKRLRNEFAEAMQDREAQARADWQRSREAVEKELIGNFNKQLEPLISELRELRMRLAEKEAEASTLASALETAQAQGAKGRTVSDTERAQELQQRASDKIRLERQSQELKDSRERIAALERNAEKLKAGLDAVDGERKAHEAVLAEAERKLAAKSQEAEEGMQRLQEESLELRQEVSGLQDALRKESELARSLESQKVGLDRTIANILKLLETERQTPGTPRGREERNLLAKLFAGLPAALTPKKPDPPK